uniref:transposase n=1 Tax=Okeania sp. SIO2F4 TaxID=2607790 RepID=UPI0025F2743E|nr:transposase [Okeania sp. SIO2F4]
MSRGYYAQFAIQTYLKMVGAIRQSPLPTGKAVGLDVGIKYFLANSNGDTTENPEFYRKSEKQLKRANRQKSKKYNKGAKP